MVAILSQAALTFSSENVEIKNKSTKKKKKNLFKMLLESFIFNHYTDSEFVRCLNYHSHKYILWVHVTILDKNI